MSYFSLTGADVVIVNAGRSTIQVRGALPAGGEVLLAAGVRNLPDDLPPGIPTVVHVPRLSGDVAAAGGSITLTLLGQSVSFPANCQRIDLDGATLLGRQTSVTLGARQRHDLQLACG